jgi:hypothetical protein
VREIVVPDETAIADVVIEDDTPTAPDQTATEIAIEDEKPSGLVETSLRPVSRPSRPAPPTPEPETPTEISTASDRSSDNLINDILADLDLEDTPASVAPAVAAGPPLSGSEHESFRVAVNRCWNVDPGSAAARVTVEVAFNMTSEGLIDGDIMLVSAVGDAGAKNIAFEAARRAILRCQSGGYNLPADKYEHWRSHTMVFDPSQMRRR